MGKSVSARLLSVLGAFDDTHRRLTLSELSRRSGLPIATTHRLVAELVEWGALTRLTAGRATGAPSRRVEVGGEFRGRLDLPSRGLHGLAQQVAF